MDFSLSESYSMIMDKLETWIDGAIRMLPNFILAVLILLLFVFIARIARNVSNKVLKKSVKKQALRDLFSTIVYSFIVILGTFFALGVLNLDKTVTSLLAGAGIIGLALGFAFQDIAANFISGIIMAVRSPFKIGDLIETNNIMGRVKSITLRDTEMITLQGQYVTIPNKELFQNPLKNYSVPARTRIDLECGVSYGDDLEKVRKITKEALEKVPNRLQDKDIKVFFTEFGGSSINLVAQIWINYEDQVDFLNSRSEAIISLKKAYDNNDIMIPFPIRTLDFGIKGGEKLEDMLKENTKDS